MPSPFPPTWLILGVLLCFLEALWMGMVLDGGHHNNNNNNNNNNYNDRCHEEIMDDRNVSKVPTRRQPWPFLIQQQQYQQLQNEEEEESSAAAAPVVCTQQNPVIFVGLDQVETSIVGTIAMNLRQSCRRSNDNNNNNNKIIFMQEPLSCSVLFSQQQEQQQQQQQPPRLVAFLRNPPERAVAEFFRWISIHHLEPTDERFKHFLLQDDEAQHVDNDNINNNNSNSNSNNNNINLEHYYLRHLSWKEYLSASTNSSSSSSSSVNETTTNNNTKLSSSTSSSSSSSNEFRRKQLRSEILQRYDFIGTTKRLLESLVMLKMLWGLSWRDIMFLPSDSTFFFLHPTSSSSPKDTGGTTLSTSTTTTTTNSNSSSSPSCIYQVPTFTNTEREKFLQKNARWKRRIAGDVSLYGAVNARLDATRDLLGGYDVVQEQVRIYQQLLQQAIDECWTSTTFPCSANGDVLYNNHSSSSSSSSCIEGEWGCGHECLTQFMRRTTTITER